MKVYQLLSLLLISNLAFSQIPKQSNSNQSGDAEPAYGTHSGSGAGTGNGTGDNIGYFQKNGKYGLRFSNGKKTEPIYEKVKTQNGMFIVTQNKLKGVIDKNGVEILKIEFDSILTTNNYVSNNVSNLIVKKNNLFGVFSNTGTKILPIKYQKIIYYDNKVQFTIVENTNKTVDLITNSNGSVFIKNIQDAYTVDNTLILKKDKEIGIFKDLQFYKVTADSIISAINKRSNSKTTNQKKSRFHYLSNYSYAPASPYLISIKNNKKGIIDLTGKSIYPEEIDEINYDTNNLYFSLKKDQLYSIFFVKNNLKTPFEYEKVRTDGVGNIMVTKNKKDGAYDLSGNLVIPFEYDSGSIFRASSNNGFYAKKNGKVGLIDKNGSVLIEPKYDNIDSDYHFKNRYIVTSNEKKGILNEKGEIIIPIEFYWVGEDDNNYKVVTSETDGKVGIYDKDGKIIFPAKYNWISNTDTPKSKIFVLRNDNHTADLMDTNNKNICSESVTNFDYILNEDQLYNPISSNFIQLLYVKNSKGKYGLIDEVKMKMIAPFMYDQIIQKLELQKSTYIVVKKGDKVGVINQNNETIIPFEYNKIDFNFLDSSSYLSFVASKKNKFGLISLTNEAIIPFEYEYLERISNSLLKAKKKGKYILINTSNKILNAGPFDEISNVENVEDNYNPRFEILTFYKGKISVIDEKGQLVTKDVENGSYHNGYKTFDELKTAFILALDSKDDLLLKEFSSKIALSKHLIYFLEKSDIKNNTSLRYLDLNEVQNKYYNDLLKFKREEWNSSSPYAYQKQDLIAENDYTFIEGGVVKNRRFHNHAFGDTRFLEKVLRNNVKVNGFWISTYFAYPNFEY